jgi:dihydroneopterin aldolase
VTIHIQNLTFDTIIGILDFERTTPQKVIVDIDIEYKFDDKFIDYSIITKLIQDSMNKHKFLLIEDALLWLKDAIVSKYPQIKSLDIKITKPQILSNCSVGVSNFWKF